jgi:hypothetical protein
MLQKSLAAFYYSFPTLPQHYLSSLENIFVALVYKSKDARHGNDACFNILVQEITFLSRKARFITSVFVQLSHLFISHISIHGTKAKSH